MAFLRVYTGGVGDVIGRIVMARKAYIHCQKLLVAIR